MTGPRIVLVDSKPERRAVMRSIVILALGSDSVVGVAANRSEAVATVRSSGANAAIVDLDMPEDEGVATIVSLRAAHPHLVVVVCSFGSHRATRTEAVDAGADAYLGKPVSLDQIRTINGLVRVREGISYAI
jgi:DNA-binding NarL/FixJ family response regulator